MPEVTVKPGAIGRLGLESAAYALGGALASAVNIILLPVYTAAIPPHEYGVLDADHDWVPALQRESFTSAAPLRRSACEFIWSAAALTLLTAGIIVSGALLAPERASGTLFGTAEFANPTTLAFLSVAASSVAQPLMLGMQFRRSVSRYVRIYVISAACAGALGFSLVARLNRGLAGVLEAQLASQVLLLGLSVRENLIAGSRAPNGPRSKACSGTGSRSCRLSSSWSCFSREISSCSRIFEDSKTSACTSSATTLASR